ncbi:MAG: hypothetical protein JXL80_02660 [Planctomycetes bacterium]|nr:hypothetical protein [Planctomycetota bacterium]
MKYGLCLIAAVVVVAWLCGPAGADRYDGSVKTDGQGAVLVVRNSRTAPTQEQTQTIAACFDRVRSMLEAAGLPLRVVDDTDVSPEVLAEASLVVLPYNPLPTPSLGEHLPTYVRKGGKVLDLGGSSETQRVVGLDELASRKARRDGEFASLVFADDAPSGLPAVSNPATSVHIMDVTEPGTRVLAHWASGDGKRSPYPAAIETPGGIYLTGMLTGDDAERKVDLLLRLSAHLCPSLGPRAVERLLGRVSLKPSDRDDWRTVARLAAESRSLLESDPLGAAAVARKAVAACELASAADMPARENELRVAWVPNPLAGEAIDWDALAGRLAEARFTAIVVESGSPAYAAYPSRIFAAGDKLRARGDQVAAALKAAHAHGLKLYVLRHSWHAVGDNGFAGGQLATLRLSQEDDKRATIDWACPNRGNTVERELAAIEELLTAYDVDGYVLASVGFAGPNACTCRECQAAAERRLSKTIENWPDDLFQDGPPRHHWLALRRETVAAAVGRAAEVVRRVRPKAKVLAALSAEDIADADRAGLNWSAWVDAKSIDLLLAVDCDVPDENLAGVVTDQVSRAAGRVPVVPILAPAAARAASLDWAAMARRIDAARSGGASGYGLLPLADRSGRLMELLRVGPNRPAVKPQADDSRREP